MGALKNKTQSELHKKYIELKRRITSEQHMLDYEKRQMWDIFCDVDRIDFERRQSRIIKWQKEELVELHKECRELKKQLLEANRSYQHKHKIVKDIVETGKLILAISDEDKKYFPDPEKRPKSKRLQHIFDQIEYENFKNMLDKEIVTE